MFSDKRPLWNSIEKFRSDLAQNPKRGYKMVENFHISTEAGMTLFYWRVRRVGIFSGSWAGITWILILNSRCKLNLHYFREKCLNLVSPTKNNNKAKWQQQKKK